MNQLGINSFIGIVSGTGPLAGANVLEKVFKYAANEYGAVQDDAYPDVLLVNHGTEGVDNLGTLNGAFERETLSAIKYLEKQGATVIGVACNTAHIHLGEIKLKPQTTLVNLIDAISAEAAQKPAQYLLMTSKASRDEKLFHKYLKKYDVSFTETSDGEQNLLDEVISQVMAYKLVQAGQTIKKVFALAKRRGVTDIIAGCTEFPLAIDRCDDAQNFNIIDCNHVLAKNLADKYYAGTIKVLKQNKTIVTK